MNILIITDFCSNFDKNGNSRYTYLAELLQDNGHIVEILTSDFNHLKKKHCVKIPNELKYKVTTLHEPRYKKNVCIKRFYSHYIWGCNVKKYLQSINRPDVIICAVPTLKAAIEASKYCRMNNIRFIVDIQDLWPEAFKMVVNIPILSDIGFYPMRRMADRIYSAADEIVSVSDTYTKRALSVNKKCKKGHSIFLGTMLETFDENVKNNLVEKDMQKFVIGYCGTLGASYDITCVIDALALLENHNYVFLVMGDGPRKEEFEVYAKKKNVNCNFVGRLNYPEMCGRLVTCDIVVNPITHGAAQSIINKHADYAASGLPVINTQECSEYRNLVEEYNMGFNCNNNDFEDVARKIQILIDDSDLRKKMGNNARRCAEERFDRSISYQKILDVVTGKEECNC